MSLDRRSFLFTLAESGAALSGWILFGQLPSSSDQVRSREPGYAPRLAAGVCFRRAEGGGRILRIDPQGSEDVVCEANSDACTILESLDGHRTVRELAECLRAGSPTHPVDYSEAAVASFLAMLAQAGLLAEPYHVNLQSAVYTA
jgi:hypothetical protein